MYKTIFLIAALILINSSANASLPYTFTSGTKAKASEVNANFEYLNGEIASIKNGNNGDDVSNPPASPEPYTCPLQPSDFPYTYTHIDSPLGSSLYVSGVEYRVSKFAVTDPQGVLYHITMPFRVSSQTTPTNSTYVNFKPYLNRQVGHYECGGPPVFGDAEFVWNKPTGFLLNKQINYSNDGDDDSYSSSDTALTENISYSGTILIGSLFMSISISTAHSIYETLVSNDDYDFTDNIPVSGNPDYSTQLTELTRFLNHIKVERITQ